MNLRKLTLTGFAVLAALLGGVLFATAPALAKELYLQDYSFGPEGPGAGSFGGIEGMAVDQASGDVYVYSASAGTLSKFDAAGEPAEFTALHSSVIEGVGTGFAGAAFNQVTVDESSGPTHGDIYVATYEALAIYDPDGTRLGELNSAVASEVAGSSWQQACGVAVGPTGHVYVGEFYFLNTYTPTANPVRNTDYTAEIGGFYGLCNVAVDRVGTLYEQSGFGGLTRRYSAGEVASGQGSGQEIDGAGRAIAVDPATNDVFVDEESGHVAQFDAAGNLIRRFATLSGESFGVGVNGTSHEVYVADTPSGKIDAFKLVDVTPPAVNDQAPVAAAIGRTTVTLSGTLDPQGYDTTYKFVYGPSSDYVHSTATFDGGASGGDESVGPVSLEGLSPGTTYHYALVATNPAGTTTGPDQTFTTATPTPPVVATGAASGVGQTSVTLAGTVDNRGLAGTYGFEIGTSAGVYGPRIGLGLVHTGGTAVSAALNVVGLEPGITYHYRVTSTNADGTSYGADESFTTGVLASAAVETPPALPQLRIPTVVFPKEAATPKASTNAQKLAKALKACKQKAKSKRGACERQARKKYAPAAKKKAKKK